MVYLSLDNYMERLCLTILIEKVMGYLYDESRIYEFSYAGHLVSGWRDRF